MINSSQTEDKLTDPNKLLKMQVKYLKKFLILFLQQF